MRFWLRSDFLARRLRKITQRLPVALGVRRQQLRSRSMGRALASTRSAEHSADRLDTLQTFVRGGACGWAARTRSPATQRRPARPRQPDPIAAAANLRMAHRHPGPGRQPSRCAAEQRARTRHCRRPRPGASLVIGLPAVPCRRSWPPHGCRGGCADPDDGIYNLCQHGHAAHAISFAGVGPTSDRQLGGVTGWHICDGSRQRADRPLIRSTRCGQAGAWRHRRQVRRTGTHTRGQIRSESPGITGTDPGGSPPQPPGDDTRSPIRSWGQHGR